MGGGAETVACLCGGYPPRRSPVDDKGGGKTIFRWPPFFAPLWLAR